MSQDEIIDLAQLAQQPTTCSSNRRAFCLGAGAGLLVLAGCGAEDPRIETGGIDTLPGGLPASATPDMAHSGGTSGGTTSGTGGTSGGSTTTGGTSGGSTTGGTSGGTTGTAATCDSSFISAGAASAVVMGKAKRVRSGNLDAWLCRDANGYYALDNWCPHRGCTVSFQSAGSFFCGCHGATFDFNGKNTNRESPSPMDHLVMCIDAAGNAYIDPTQTTSSTTRV